MLSVSVASRSLNGIQGCMFSTSVRLDSRGGRRRSRQGKKISKNAATMDELLIKKAQQSSAYCVAPVIMPTSPLQRTLHPKNPFADDEEERMRAIRQNSMA